MNKGIILIGLIVLFTGCASAPFEDWDREDTLRQVAYSTLHVVDWMQTKEIARNDDFYELNPILGREPSQGKVDLYMGATLAANWFIAAWLKPEYRGIWQGVIVGVEATCVMNNYQIGVRW